MKIQRLIIENFKSIERIELVEPNPFTVFVGPNGSGKSNIFEALEFVNSAGLGLNIVLSLFGGLNSLRRRQNPNGDFYSKVDLEIMQLEFTAPFSKSSDSIKSGIDIRNKRFNDTENQIDYLVLFRKFNRLFVGKNSLVRFNFSDNERLTTSASNLEKVLKRVLSIENFRSEIFEWLELFVPSFKSVEVDERDELHWYEKSSSDYFTKDLISDGTYNILALLTAVYQSDEPQFLCIEEPENGLNPKVITEFVNLCRYACEEFGHFIWLNTHSQSLVSKLTTDEIILVDKVDGATQTKQVKGMDLHDLPVDEAWLSNALGGGIPW